MFDCASDGAGQRMVYRFWYALFFCQTEGKPVEMTRYSVIEDKNPREIVLLRGRGCAWKRCRFCD